MCNILLLSHGYLAKELLATAQMIYGEVESVEYIALPSGMDLDQYEKQIIKAVQQSEEGTLILVDVFGGTPFITASRIYSQYREKIKMSVVTGMNLPMILEAISNRDSMDLGRLKESVMESGTEGIIDLSERV